MRVLAVDPGYEKVGLAVLERKSGREVVRHSECFFTDRGSAPQERLRLIGCRVAELITDHEPDALAVETLFFTKNQKTAMLVSEARGVIIYEAAKRGLRVFEYTPLQVKIAVTGYGRSDKSQVKFMVEKLIAVGKSAAADKEDDEYDAIALGLTCFASETREKPFSTKYA